MSKVNADRVLEVLSDLVSNESQEAVTLAVTSLLDETVAELKANYEEEYNARLEEAYAAIVDERRADRQVAIEGYQQAYSVITDLRNRLKAQETEMNSTLEEEYGKAYEKFVEEQKKHEQEIQEMYEHFNQKSQDIQSYIIDKVDEFLGEMGQEYYESVKSEAVKDPAVNKDKLAFQKILEVAAKYLTEDDLESNQDNKEMQQQIESLELSKKQLESRNMKLLTENQKMQSYLKDTKVLLEQYAAQEKNERLDEASKVEGQGLASVEPKREVVIGEQTEVNKEETTKNENNDWAALAGIE